MRHRGAPHSIVYYVVWSPTPSQHAPVSPHPAPRRRARRHDTPLSIHKAYKLSRRSGQIVDRERLDILARALEAEDSRIEVELAVQGVFDVLGFAKAVCAGLYVKMGAGQASRVRGAGERGR